MAYFDEFMTANLTSFQNDCFDGSSAREKMLERLIGFLKFWIECG